MNQSKVNWGCQSENVFWCRPKTLEETHVCLYGRDPRPLIGSQPLSHRLYGNQGQKGTSTIVSLHKRLWSFSTEPWWELFLWERFIVEKIYPWISTYTRISFFQVDNPSTCMETTNLTILVNPSGFQLRCVANTAPPQENEKPMLQIKFFPKILTDHEVKLWYFTVFFCHQPTEMIEITPPFWSAFPD